MLAVVVLLSGAALAGYRVLEELRVDTGGLEVALVAAVVQAAGAVAGLLRLSGAWFVMGVLLSLHVVVWMGLGVLTFFSGVLPSGGGWFPVQQWDLGILIALVAAAIVLGILYRYAFRSAMGLRDASPPGIYGEGQVPK